MTGTATRVYIRVKIFLRQWVCCMSQDSGRIVRILRLFFFFFFLSIDAKIVNNKRSGTSGPTRTEESYCEIQAVKESME